MWSTNLSNSISLRETLAVSVPNRPGSTGALMASATRIDGRLSRSMLITGAAFPRSQRVQISMRLLALLGTHCFFFVIFDRWFHIVLAFKECAFIAVNAHASMLLWHGNGRRINSTVAVALLGAAVEVFDKSDHSRWQHRFNFDARDHFDGITVNGLFDSRIPEETPEASNGRVNVRSLDERGESRIVRFLITGLVDVEVVSQNADEKARCL